VDGGNSKTDVALVSERGELLARVRGAAVSHQVPGQDARRGYERLAALVDEARQQAELPASARASLAVYCLAGADFPSDIRLIRQEIARHGLADDEVVLNDCFGALRAGAPKGWGVVLICGRGINAAAVGPDGHRARFAGIGTLSGDWGGAGELGTEAIGAAIRARDGRGPRTTLERVVADHFDRKTPEAVMLAMYEERLSSRRLDELAPSVFREAAGGDAVARALVDRLADELSGMAIALIKRLKLRKQDVDVVLAGGTFNTKESGFYSRLEGAVLAVAPGARFVRSGLPPVAGAALLALDRRSGTGRASPADSARLAKSFERMAT